LLQHFRFVNPQIPCLHHLAHVFGTLTTDSAGAETLQESPQLVSLRTLSSNHNHKKR